MPHVPNKLDTDTSTTNRQYVGILFDAYTPAVEGQLLRDLMACCSTLSRGEELIVVSESQKADTLLKTLGIRRLPIPQKARVWLLYKVGDQFPLAPDWCSSEVQRDLQIREKDPNFLLQVDPDQGNGYYLPPQGRLSPDTLSLERPAPNGYIPTDPVAFQVWSPNLG